jgi:Outer membrane protein beta-barrel domain
MVGLVASVLVVTGSPATAAPVGVDSRMRVGFNLIPMPTGTFKTSFGGVSLSQDLEFAFGLSPFFDYLLTPNFFVGFGPSYSFNVKGKDATGSSGTELDLLLRVGAGAPISDSVQLFGYLTPGYSVIMPPSGNGNDPKGFVLGLHGGAMYSASPTVFLNADIGYQIGFQQLTQTEITPGGTRVDATVDSKFSYLQIVLGGGIRL